MQNVESRLKTKVFRKIHYFQVTSSTNDEAIRRAKEGDPEGEIFIAEKQTSGRGRMGRNWESPEGKNLYISLLLRPRLSSSQANLLTLVAGAAIFDAVTPFAPKNSLKIKWPNDLYLNDKKMAGILTESGSSSDQKSWVVCGIGINLNTDPADFPPEVRKSATSLKVAIGKEVNRTEMAVRLIEAFEQRYLRFCKTADEGTSELLRFVDQHSYLKGKRVQWEGGVGVRHALPRLKGIAIGLSPEGYLLIKTDSGETKPVFSGDVVLENP